MLNPNEWSMSLKILLIFSIGLLGGSELRADELAYSDLERLVREKNLHVRSAEDSYMAARYREGHLFRSFLPRVSLDGGYDYFQKELFPTVAQPFAGATAEVNLFNSGRDVLQSRIRDAQTQVSGAERAQTARDELLKAQTEFWQVIYLSELGLLLKSALERNKKNLEAAKRRTSAGLAAQSDQMEFVMAGRLIAQDLAKAETHLKSAKQKLNVLLGRDPATEFEIKDKLPSSVDASFEDFKLDYSSLSEVVIASSASDIAQLEFSQSSRWWAPKIDAYTSARQMNMRESGEFAMANRREYVVGAKVSINLFDGGDSIANSQSLSAQARSLENKALQSSRELSIEFESAKSELKQLAQLVNETSEDVQIAERFLGLILSEYSRGVKSSSEVLSASDRSFEYQKRFAELRKDYQISKSKVLSLTARGSAEN
jgi:outer membrane protein TolC